jgi:diguanylate cyclase (GGDEF)-like protein
LETEYQKTKRTLEIREIEVRAILAQAHELANTDVLTFLPNRRKIISTCRRRSSVRTVTARRSRSRSSWTLTTSRTYQRFHGHMTGDEVLRNVAARLREQVRHPDTIGRYGGEEFLIVLPNSRIEGGYGTSLAPVPADPQDDGNGIDEQTGTFCLSITISIGVAQFRVGQENWEGFLHRADEALYQAKNAGRDRWMVAE